MPKGVNAVTGKGNNFKDRTGQVFGQLTAETYVGNYMWKVRCVCGTQLTVDIRNLVAGRTVSCGCQRFVNLKGTMFGHLKPYEHVVGSLHSMWRCRCSCGNIITVRAENLVSGKTKSCGCTRPKHGHTKNGKSTGTYRSYYAMLQRCTNPNTKYWNNVSVCKRWQGKNGFIHFLADMGPRPKGTTNGRYLDTGDYKPSNCKWMTKVEQVEEARNKRLRKRIQNDKRRVCSK